MPFWHHKEAQASEWGDGAPSPPTGGNKWFSYVSVGRSHMTTQLVTLFKVLSELEA